MPIFHGGLCLRVPVWLCRGLRGCGLRELPRYNSPGAKLEGSAWYLLTRHRIRSMLKNFSGRRLLSGGTAHLMLLGAYSIREVCRGHPARAKDVVRALWWNAVRIRSTLRLRREVQRSRVVSDGQLLASGRLLRPPPPRHSRTP